MTKSVKEQNGQIMDIQFGKEKEYFITASKDHSSVIYDSTDLSVFRKFDTERPCNAAAISPIRPHIMLGGGQDAYARLIQDGGNDHVSETGEIRSQVLPSRV
jgi:translation initiation factor 3 subunit I